jgi:hemoglobin
MATLYEQLGKEDGIRPVVQTFYDKVLQDSLLKEYFVNTNMTRQLDMQTKFLAQVMGGPAFNGKSMRAAHARLKLTDEHFDRVIQLLGEALTQHGVPSDIISTIAGAAEGLRNDVLGR